MGADFTSIAANQSLNLPEGFPSTKHVGPDPLLCHTTQIKYQDGSSAQSLGGTSLRLL